MAERRVGFDRLAYVLFDDRVGDPPAFWSRAQKAQRRPSDADADADADGDGDGDGDGAPNGVESVSRGDNLARLSRRGPGVPFFPRLERHSRPVVPRALLGRPDDGRG